MVHLLLQAEQIHKLTTLFTQNDNFFHPGPFWVSFCEFAQLEATVFFSQPEIIHMIKGSTEAELNK